MKTKKLKTTSVPKGYKLIPGFERYAISTDGKVFSLINDRHLKLTLNAHGYLAVGLCLNGKNSTQRIHCLVALTFIGPRPTGYEVCHNNGNKLDNNLKNLRYDTKANNFADQLIHGDLLCGEDHARSKLTAEQVNQICKDYVKIHRTKSNARELAKKYNVTRETIGRIVGGRAWKRFLTLAKHDKHKGE